jgi:hypothetical protein
MWTLGLVLMALAAWMAVAAGPAFAEAIGPCC